MSKLIKRTDKMVFEQIGKIYRVSLFEDELKIFEFDTERQADRFYNSLL